MLGAAPSANVTLHFDIVRRIQNRHPRPRSGHQLGEGALFARIPDHKPVIAEHKQVTRARDGWPFARLDDFVRRVRSVTAQIGQ